MAEKTNVSNGTSSNPWRNDTASNPLKVALAVGESFGHYPKNSENCKYSQLQSLQLIDVLRSTTEKKKQLSKVNHDIHNRMLDKETTDITSLDVLDVRVQEIEILNTYLQMIIDKKREIIRQIHEPFVGQHIQLHTSAHQQTVELFRDLAPILSELSANLMAIEWITNQTYAQHKSDELLCQIATSLANQQTAFTVVNQIRNESHNNTSQSLSLKRSQ